MKLGKNSLKFISCVLICVYTLSTHTLPSANAQSREAKLSSINSEYTPLKISEATLPSSLGRIEEFYEGNSEKTVLLIQDAHGIPAAQENIQKTIEHFQTTYGVNRVALEGAVSTLDTQFLKSFPDQVLLRKVLQEYADAGELTGTSAAAVFNEVPAVYQGVEDWALYEKGLELYLEAMRNAPEIEKSLSEAKQSLLAEKQEVYSEDLLKLDQLVEGFESGEVDFLNYLKRLSVLKQPKKDSKIAAILKSLENEGKIQASAQIQIKKIAASVEELLKTNSDRSLAQEFNQKYQQFQTTQISLEAFALWMKEVLVSLPQKNSVFTQKAIKQLRKLSENEAEIRAIRGSQLFSELENYAQNIKETLFENDEQRNLDKLTEELRVLNQLNRLELTHKDWKKLQGMGNREWGVVNQLASIPQPLIPTLQGFSAHLRFYETADARDQAFYQNTLSFMKQSKANTAILVAGGFHTQALTDRFKEEGVSYFLVSPTILEVPKESSYKEHMRGNVSWKEYYQIKKGRVSLYDAFMRGIRDRLVSASSENSGVLLKTWRDNLMSDLALQKRLVVASQYTKFIDEINKDLKSYAFPVVNQFIEAIKKLEVAGNFNAQTVTNLLMQPSTQGDGTYAIFDRGASISVSGWGPLAQMASEVRDLNVNGGLSLSKSETRQNYWDVVDDSKNLESELGRVVRDARSRAPVTFPPNRLLERFQARIAAEVPTFQNLSSARGGVVIDEPKESKVSTEPKTQQKKYLGSLRAQSETRTVPVSLQGPSGEITVEVSEDDKKLIEYFSELKKPKAELKIREVVRDDFPKKFIWNGHRASSTEAEGNFDIYGITRGLLAALQHSYDEDLDLNDDEQNRVQFWIIYALFEIRHLNFYADTKELKEITYRFWWYLLLHVMFWEARLDEATDSLYDSKKEWASDLYRMIFGGPDKEIETQRLIELAKEELLTLGSRYPDLEKVVGDVYRDYIASAYDAVDPDDEESASQWQFYGVIADELIKKRLPYAEEADEDDFELSPGEEIAAMAEEGQAGAYDLLVIRGLVRPKEGSLEKRYWEDPVRALVEAAKDKSVIQYAEIDPTFKRELDLPQVWSFNLALLEGLAEQGVTRWVLSLEIGEYVQKFATEGESLDERHELLLTRLEEYLRSEDSIKINLEDHLGLSSKWKDDFRAQQTLRYWRHLRKLIHGDEENIDRKYGKIDLLFVKGIDIAAESSEVKAWAAERKGEKIFNILHGRDKFSDNRDFNRLKDLDPNDSLMIGQVYSKRFYLSPSSAAFDGYLKAIRFQVHQVAEMGDDSLGWGDYTSVALQVKGGEGRLANFLQKNHETNELAKKLFDKDSRSSDILVVVKADGEDDEEEETFLDPFDEDDSRTPDADDLVPSGFGGDQTQSETRSISLEELQKEVKETIGSDAFEISISKGDALEVLNFKLTILGEAQPVLEDVADLIDRRLESLGFEVEEEPSLKIDGNKLVGIEAAYSGEANDKVPPLLFLFSAIGIFMVFVAVLTPFVLADSISLEVFSWMKKVLYLSVTVMVGAFAFLVKENRKKVSLEEIEEAIEEVPYVQGFDIETEEDEEFDGDIGAFSVKIFGSRNRGATIEQAGYVSQALQRLGFIESGEKMRVIERLDSTVAGIELRYSRQKIASLEKINRLAFIGIFFAAVAALMGLGMFAYDIKNETHEVYEARERFDKKFHELTDRLKKMDVERIKSTDKTKTSPKSETRTEVGERGVEKLPQGKPDKKRKTIFNLSFWTEALTFLVATVIVFVPLVIMGAFFWQLAKATHDIRQHYREEARQHRLEMERDNKEHERIMRGVREVLEKYPPRKTDEVEAKLPASRKSAQETQKKTSSETRVSRDEIKSSFEGKISSRSLVKVLEGNLNDVVKFSITIAGDDRETLLKEGSAVSKAVKPLGFRSDKRARPIKEGGREIRGIEIIYTKEKAVATKQSSLSSLKKFFAKNILASVAVIGGMLTVGVLVVILILNRSRNVGNVEEGVAKPDQKTKEFVDAPVEPVKIEPRNENLGVPVGNFDEVEKAELVRVAEIKRAIDGLAPYRFAKRYTQEELLNNPKLANRFFDELAYWEGEALPFLYDHDLGVTRDGIRIDYKTGLLKAYKPHSAASKEALDIEEHALALAGNRRMLIAQSAAINSTETEKIKKHVLDILRKKITTYENFDREYPGFGGFLPWYLIVEKKIEPTNDWTDRVPILDNGELIVAMDALVGVLQKVGEHELADRYQSRIDKMTRNMIIMFYGEGGRFWAESYIRNTRAVPSKDNYFFDTPLKYKRLGQGNYPLNDQHEGQLALIWAYLYGDWSSYPASEREEIWNFVRSNFKKASYVTADGRMIETEKRHWGSAHELWTHRLLPTSDVPLVKQKLKNFSKIQTDDARQNGFPFFGASVNPPVDDNASKEGDYVSAAGVSAIAAKPVTFREIWTPYAGMQLFLSGPVGISAAWTDRFLEFPKMQGPLGMSEAMDAQGRIAPYKTWDATVGNALLAVAQTPGQKVRITDIVRDRLKLAGKYKEFVGLLDRENTRAFPDGLAGGDAPFALPPREVDVKSSGQEFKIPDVGAEEAAVHLLNGTGWRGDGDVLATVQQSFEASGRKSFELVKGERGFAFTEVTPVDLTHSPYFNVPVVTNGEGYLIIEFKHTGDRLMTNSKTYISLPNTQGKEVIITINLLKSTTSLNKRVGYVIFPDPGVSAKVGDATFTSKPPKNSVRLVWDSFQYGERSETRAVDPNKEAQKILESLGAMTPAEAGAVVANIVTELLNRAQEAAQAPRPSASTDPVLVAALQGDEGEYVVKKGKNGPNDFVGVLHKETKELRIYEGPSSGVLPIKTLQNVVRFEVRTIEEGGIRLVVVSEEGESDKTDRVVKLYKLMFLVQKTGSGSGLGLSELSLFDEGSALPKFDVGSLSVGDRHLTLTSEDNVVYRFALSSGERSIGLADYAATLQTHTGKVTPQEFNDAVEEVGLLVSEGDGNALDVLANAAKRFDLAGSLALRKLIEVHNPKALEEDFAASILKSIEQALVEQRGISTDEVEFAKVVESHIWADENLKDYASELVRLELQKNDPESTTHKKFQELSSSKDISSEDLNYFYSFFETALNFNFKGMSDHFHNTLLSLAKKAVSHSSAKDELLKFMKEHPEWVAYLHGRWRAQGADSSSDIKLVLDFFEKEVDEESYAMFHRGLHVLNVTSIEAMMQTTKSRDQKRSRPQAIAAPYLETHKKLQAWLFRPGNSKRLDFSLDMFQALALMRDDYLEVSRENNRNSQENQFPGYYRDVLLPLSQNRIFLAHLRGVRSSVQNSSNQNNQEKPAYDTLLSFIHEVDRLARLTKGLNDFASQSSGQPSNLSAFEMAGRLSLKKFDTDLGLRVSTELLRKDFEEGREPFRFDIFGFVVHHASSEDEIKLLQKIKITSIDVDIEKTDTLRSLLQKFGQAVPPEQPIIDGESEEMLYKRLRNLLFDTSEGSFEVYSYMTGGGQSLVNGVASELANPETDAGFWKMLLASRDLKVLDLARTLVSSEEGEEVVTPESLRREYGQEATNELGKLFGFSFEETVNYLTKSTSTFKDGGAKYGVAEKIESRIAYLLATAPTQAPTPASETRVTPNELIQYLNAFRPEDDKALSTNTLVASYKKTIEGVQVHDFSEQNQRSLISWINKKGERQYFLFDETGSVYRVVFKEEALKTVVSDFSPIAWKTQVSSPGKERVVIQPTPRIITQFFEKRDGKVFFLELDYHTGSGTVIKHQRFSLPNKKIVKLINLSNQNKAKAYQRFDSNGRAFQSLSGSDGFFEVGIGSYEDPKKLLYFFVVDKKVYIDRAENLTPTVSESETGWAPLPLLYARESHNTFEYVDDRVRIHIIVDASGQVTLKRGLRTSDLSENGAWVDVRALLPQSSETRTFEEDEDVTMKISTQEALLASKEITDVALRRRIGSHAANVSSVVDEFVQTQVEEYQPHLVIYVSNQEDLDDQEGLRRFLVPELGLSEGDAKAHLSDFISNTTSLERLSPATLHIYDAEVLISEGGERYFNALIVSPDKNLRVAYDFDDDLELPEAAAETRSEVVVEDEVVREEIDLAAEEFESAMEELAETLNSSKRSELELSEVSRLAEVVTRAGVQQVARELPKAAERVMLEGARQSANQVLALREPTVVRYVIDAQALKAMKGNKTVVLSKLIERIALTVRSQKNLMIRLEISKAVQRQFASILKEGFKGKENADLRLVPSEKGIFIYNNSLEGALNFMESEAKVVVQYNPKQAQGDSRMLDSSKHQLGSASIRYEGEEGAEVAADLFSMGVYLAVEGISLKTQQSLVEYEENLFRTLEAGSLRKMRLMSRLLTRTLVSRAA